jgi:SNF2 family DNA or RNA helicase
MDLHGLGCLIAPDVIRPAINWFRERVMIKDTYSIHSWHPKPDWQDTLWVKAIMERSLTMRLRDAIAMPPVTYADVKVRLTAEQKDAIERLRREAQAFDGAVTAMNVTGLRAKIHAICAGYLLGDDGETAFDIKSNRVDHVVEILSESDEPALVFAWNIRAVEEIARALDAPAVTGATPVEERIKYCNQMQAGELKVIVANPRTLGHGLTLTKARRVIFAQLPASLELYLQAVSRCARIGQEGHVTVYHLFSPPEAHILNALRDKKALKADLEAWHLLLQGLTTA